MGIGVQILCKRAQMFSECSGILGNSGWVPRLKIWQNAAIF